MRQSSISFADQVIDARENIHPVQMGRCTRGLNTCPGVLEVHAAPVEAYLVPIRAVRRLAVKHINATNSTADKRGCQHHQITKAARRNPAQNWPTSQT